MTAPTVYPSADGLYRITDGLGVWPYRGQVAAVGVGHSPTLRRWDGDPHKSIGAWAILAIRRAIEDAGVDPAEVDGIVFDSGTTTGAFWPEGEPVPADFLAAFENTSDPFDGLIQLSGGVAGEESARADRPEVRDGRGRVHVEMRSRGGRGGGPGDGQRGAGRKGLAQHPGPVRRPRG